MVSSIPQQLTHTRTAFVQGNGAKKGRNMQNTFKGDTVDVKMGIDPATQQAYLTMIAPDGALSVYVDEFRLGMLMTGLEQIADRMTKAREQREALRRTTLGGGFPFAKQHTQAAA